MAETGKMRVENMKVIMFVKRKKSRHMAQQILINIKLPAEILKKSNKNPLFHK